MVYDMADEFERAGSLKRYTNLSRRYTWMSWNKMMLRCSNPSNVAYKNYGQRGIKVCERWHQFANFLEDMGLRPHYFVLSRKDHNADYSKDNCVWEHYSLAGQHKRTEVLITINGEARCLKDWSRLSGVKASTIRHRLKVGWSSDKLLAPSSNGLIKEDADNLLAALFRARNKTESAIMLDDNLRMRIHRYLLVSQNLKLA